MDLPIGVQVYCEGELCGHSTHVILNPTTNKVKYLVVEEEGPEQAHYLVPIEWLGASTPNKLVLQCSRDQMTKNMRSDDESTPVDVAGTTLAHEDSPFSELAVGQRAWVEARGSYVGLVDEFLIDPGTCGVTHVILHETHLWGSKRIVVPVSSILSIEENRVRLRLNIDGLEGLQAVLA